LNKNLLFHWPILSDGVVSKLFKSFWSLNFLPIVFEKKTRKESMEAFWIALAEGKEESKSKIEVQGRGEKEAFRCRF